MQTPGSFAKKLRAFADDLPAQRNELKKAAAQECLNQIVGDTPKDTGQAQANYVTSLDLPDTVTTYPGPGSGDASLSRGRSVIARAEPGQSVHITNNLPYIGLLNAGRSSKAPAHFVEMAVEAAKEIIRRQRVRWKV